MSISSKKLQFQLISSNCTCLPTDRVQDILFKFDETKGRPIIVLSKYGNLYGLLSSGDIRRFLSKGIEKYQKALVQEICNKNPVFVKNSESNTVIKRLLSENITIVPVLDKNNAVISFAYNDFPSLKIGAQTISINRNYIYLIAEIGVNHNGSIEEAKYLIDNANESGFDAIKLQIRSEETYSSDPFEGKDLSVQYIENEIKRTELDLDTYVEIMNYIKSTNLDLICTPFDEIALDFILENNVDGLKIASCDLTNDPLIIKASQANLPIILSTGMSTESEILHANGLLDRTTNYAFLHCNSTYPAPPEDINLAYINRLRDLTNCVTGYSSHDGNFYIPLTSIGFGSRIIECHITRDRNQKGTDHLASLPIKELNNFVHTVRLISQAIGDDLPRCPSQGELMNRVALGKSLCFAESLSKGEILTEKDLILRSPSIGFKYSQISEVVGKKINQNVIEGQTLMPDYIIEKPRVSSSFPNFKSSNLIPGIPVRYHDVNFFNSIFDLPLYEFHMSSNDLTLEPSLFLNNEIFNAKKLIVHSVEQYDDGFIIDFASDSKDHQLESIKRINILIDHVNKMRGFFLNQNCIPIIVNCGGHTQHNPLSEERALEKTKHMAKTMQKIQSDHSYVQLLAQTMPPFPWHQGGRSFHNCLTTMDSILKYVECSGMKICLDISHTALAANYFGFDFNHAIEHLLDFAEHLHIADASKHNQEGQQIGEGILDFDKFFSDVLDKENTFTFIPEVWQGHLNMGDGFITALEFINNHIKND